MLANISTFVFLSVVLSPKIVSIIISVRSTNGRVALDFIFVLDKYIAPEIAVAYYRELFPHIFARLYSCFPELTLGRTLGLSGRIMQSGSKWRANGALIHARSADIISRCSMRHRGGGSLTIIAEVCSLGIRNNSALFLHGIKRNWPETLASGDWTLHVANIVRFDGGGESSVLSSRGILNIKRESCVYEHYISADKMWYFREKWSWKYYIRYKTSNKWGINC